MVSGRFLSQGREWWGYWAVCRQNQANFRAGGRPTGGRNRITLRVGVGAAGFKPDVPGTHLKKSGGWEVGTAPSLVVVDSAVAGSLSTTTLNKGIYVFFFNQKGLMGGLGLQGTKITQYTPSK